MDPHFAKIDARFDRFERYFDARLDEMERRLELRFAEQTAHFTSRLAEFEHRLTIRAGAIMLAGMSIAAAVVKLL